MYLFLGMAYLQHCFGGTDPNIHQNFTLHENGELRVRIDNEYYCLAEIDNNVVSMEFCSSMYDFVMICSKQLVITTDFISEAQI